MKRDSPCLPPLLRPFSVSLFLGYSLEILYVHCGMRREETSAFCNWQFVSASCIIFRQKKTKSFQKYLGCCPTDFDPKYGNQTWFFFPCLILPPLPLIIA